ncbi:MAG: hypothetical protein ABSH34_04190 [Verrucomicrobiota bacterium]|jgi:hypothetical protein
MCRPLRGALFVEGEGENQAAPRLLKDLWAHLELQPFIVWEVLWRNNAMKEDHVLQQGLARFDARLRNGTYGLLLVMFDADFERNGQDACPKTDAPHTAEVIRDINLPIPAAVVLPYKEYEHWFAACLPQWAGQLIIDSRTGQTIGRFALDTAGAHACLHRRDGKAIIDQHLDAGRYGERTHQPVLTEMLDFAYLCAPAQQQVADAVGFGPLQRACQFLAQAIAAHPHGAVYPPTIQ